MILRSKIQFFVIAFIGLMMFGFTSCDNVEEEIVPKYSKTEKSVQDTKGGKNPTETIKSSWTTNPSWSFYFAFNRSQSFKTPVGKMCRIIAVNGGSYNYTVTVNGHPIATVVGTVAPANIQEIYFISNSANTTVNMSGFNAIGTIQVAYQN